MITTSDTSTEVLFGLAHKTTGELLRVHRYYGDTDHYAFTPSKDVGNLYLQKDIATVIRASIINTPWYNSDNQYPSHDVDLNDYKVVEVIRTVCITAVSYTAPKLLAHHDILDCVSVRNPTTLEDWKLNGDFNHRATLMKGMEPSLSLGEKVYFNTIDREVWAVAGVIKDSNQLPPTASDRLVKLLKRYKKQNPKTYVLVLSKLNWIPDQQTEQL